ncbi:MAG: polysaccharide deacetylase family protein [Deltaproteobacteria bacterium]|nr:polysaccharide deacetylase family protein [Deltaproteobacteria bacterium]
MTRHGLSFDVEDWHQLSAIRAAGRPQPVSPKVDDCIARMLDLCDEAQVRGTFFVLGMLARARPHLVKAIAARGHEIASHSTNHELVSGMSRERFASDLRESKRMLEDLTGVEVVGFRAPEFSVRSLDNPCFATLVEEGFRYDSSVFPVGGLRYGIPDAPATPFELATASGPLVELPLATTAVARWRLPIAGGSHFRLLPTRLVAWAAERADRRDQTMVFYFHPYEFSRELLWLDRAYGGGPARNLPIWKHVALHNLATPRIARSLRTLARRLELVPLGTLAREHETRKVRA